MQYISIYMIMVPFKKKVNISINFSQLCYVRSQILIVADFTSFWYCYIGEKTNYM